MRSPDLFAKQQHVPAAARLLAHAIILIGNPAHGCNEARLRAAGAQMRAAGVHNFDLGSRSNLRNRIQRNCADYKIFHTHWRAKGYAAIFERVSEHPPHWRVVDWFAEQLRAELRGK